MARPNSILLPIFCVIGMFLHAQEKTASKFSFAIRGKYGIVGIENARWLGYNYGAEIHFGKHHLLGADGGVTRAAWDIDDGDDSDDSEILFSEIKRRTFAYIDYKFLIPLHNQVVYAQGYMKPNGRYFSFDKKRDETYAAENPEQLKEYGRGKFTEFGIGVGTMLYFKKTDGRMGVDINVSLAFRNGSSLTSHYTDDKGWYYTSDSDDLVFPNLRFTLFYHFFRYQQ